MCHQPVHRARYLIERAQLRIKEQNYFAANNLLQNVLLNYGALMHHDGLGQLYNQTKKLLQDSMSKEDYAGRD